MKIEDIDTAIAQKRQELKDIIQDEIDELMSIRYQLSTPTITHAEATRLVTKGLITAPVAKGATIKPGDVVGFDGEGRLVGMTTKQVAPVNRLDAIAKAAKRVGKTAKRYSPEQKFAILDEYEYAPVKQAVLTRHGVSAQSVSTWKTQVAAGRLVRSVG